MLIRISRAVRVTLSDTELQMLRPGELYDVPHAIGLVLVSEGWAVRASATTAGGWSERDSAADDPSGRRKGS